MYSQTQKTKSRARVARVCSQRSSIPYYTHPVLQLQRQLVHPTVQRLLQSRHIQAKLNIGEPNDKYEQEADQVADQIISMSVPIEAEQSDPDLSIQKPVIQRVCPACEEELQRQPAQQLLQARAVPGRAPVVNNEVENTISSLRGRGRPLSSSDRRFFEPRFGQNFSQVRIHSDASAADTTKAINARAFTIGQDVVFGAGEYSSAKLSGRRLLAHELTHVVQQDGVGTIKGALPPTLMMQRRTPLSAADIKHPIHGIPRSFLREVYRLQVAIHTSRGQSYTQEVPRRDLRNLASGDRILGRSIQVHRDMAGSVHNLLVAARADLATADSAADGVTRLGIRSGYRTPQRQIGMWKDSILKYYRATRTVREGLTGGRHGSAAAQTLADYIIQRLASPGYSPHQSATTIDFSYRSVSEWPGARGGWAEARTSGNGISIWNDSWFYGWLRTHAGAFGFAENPRLNEPWHWEWSPPRETRQIDN